jgi:hypothetical protein
MGWVAVDFQQLVMDWGAPPPKNSPAFPFIYPLFASTTSLPFAYPLFAGHHPGLVAVVSLAAAVTPGAPWQWCPIIATVPDNKSAQLLIAHLEGELQAGRLEQAGGALRGATGKWFASGCPP